MNSSNASASRMRAFADTWIAAWNSHDLEKILSLYSDEASMQSEYITTITGDASGTLAGKDKLRAYWGAALARRPDLHFTHLSTCAGIDTVAIHYKSVGNREAIEVFAFNDDGLVTQAAAHYA